MPLLLKAVPLHQGWHGVHYWKTPKMQDLPVELEYIPYLEFEERFVQLNEIARRRYPTYWPNIAFSLVFIAITAAATIGIIHAGTNLAIMGQGACFVLPVIVIVWYKIRKETKAIARRKFKHQSQKLLRAWTNLDTASHAIQWKLRHRTETVARLSLRPRSSHPLSTFHPELDQQPHRVEGAEWHHSTTDVVPTRGQQPSHHPEPQPGEQRLSDGRPADSIISREQQQQEHAPLSLSETEVLSLPTISIVDRAPTTLEDALSPPSPSRPSSVVEVYRTLRINTHRLSRAEPRLSRPTLQDPRPSLTTQNSTMTADTVISTILTNLAMPEERYHRSRDDATSAVEPFNLRHFLRSMMTNLHCCGYFLRERKVWLIEISLREAQLDDYALTVPSPVYCGYRLPGYDDIMSGQLAATTSPAGASSTRENLNRYTGSPPDYESDSDEDRDHRADENDDHEDTTTDRQGLVNGALTNGSGIIHQLDRSEITRTPLSESMDGPTSQPPEMVMLKRLGDELSSIVISSSLTTSSSSPRQHSAVASSSSPMDSPLTVTLGRSFTNDDDSTASTTSLPLFE